MGEVPFHMRPLEEQLELIQQAIEAKKCNVELPVLVHEDPVYESGEPEYECPVCKDLRVLDDNGVIVPCDRCGKEWQQERLRRLCGLSPHMQGWTLDRFALEFRDQVQAESRRRALAAARKAVTEPKGFLTFWGSWGTGKTYLLAAIVNECRKLGYTAIYTTVADLLDELRETFDPGVRESYTVRFERLKRSKVLALDELEKWRASDWAEEKFFQLVDERYRHCEDRLTVFATNAKVMHGCRVVKGTRWPGYLEDRLTDGRFGVVELKGGSVRPRLK